jgi:hypothetical protein
LTLLRQAAALSPSSVLLAMASLVQKTEVEEIAIDEPPKKKFFCITTKRAEVSDSRFKMIFRPLCIFVLSSFIFIFAAT